MRDVSIMDITVGVLALQGDFQEHIDCLKKIENLHDKNYRLKVIEVKDVNSLEKVDALIIPGGESTVISKILSSTSMFEEVQRFVHNPSKVVWGTCAGIILLADAHETPFSGNKIGGLDIKVSRNAYGRQVDSFKSVVQIKENEEELSDECVFFIRAPKIIQVNEENPNIKVLAYRELQKDGNKHEGEISGHQEIEPTAVLQDNRILGSTFHPEISVEEKEEEEGHISQWHKYFVNLVYKNQLNFVQAGVNV
jgi:5'-phosphate synthase pdxT subunit